MVLLVGLLYGLYNPHQLAQELGCAPGAFYGALHSLSATQWRQLLERIMRARALERLQHYQQRSEATRSRLQATLAIDDSVVKRLGRALSYVWSWYSGQFKQVVRGQDLVGLVLHINGETIPLALVWVSKQGSGPTSKPEVLLQEMKRLKEHFATHGIALTQVGMSLDSWWISQSLIEGLIELGFDKQVLAVKASLQLRDATGTANLGARSPGRTTAWREPDLGPNRRRVVYPSSLEDFRRDLSGASLARVRSAAYLGQSQRGRDVLETAQTLTGIGADAVAQTLW